MNPSSSCFRLDATLLCAHHSLPISKDNQRCLIDLFLCSEPSVATLRQREPWTDNTLTSPFQLGRTFSLVFFLRGQVVVLLRLFFVGSFCMFLRLFASLLLCQLLKTQNERITHFLVGRYVRSAVSMSDSQCRGYVCSLGGLGKVETTVVVD